MLHGTTETILCVGRVDELEVFHSPRTLVLPISPLLPMSTTQSACYQQQDTEENIHRYAERVSVT
jgi:hypothetical protein